MTTLTNPAIHSTGSPKVAQLSTGLAIEAFLVVNIASYFLAFLFRCEFAIPSDVMVWFWTTLPVVLGLKTIVLITALTKANSASKTVFKTTHVIFVAASLAAIGIYLLNLSLFQMYLNPIPRSVIAIDWALSLVFWIRLQAIGTRFLKGDAIRVKEKRKTREEAIPTISMGTGGPKVNR